MAPRRLRSRSPVPAALAAVSLVVLAVASGGCASGARTPPAGGSLPPDGPETAVHPPLHEIWHAKAGRSPAGDPVLSGPTLVLAASDRQIRLLNLDTGELHWRRKTKGTPIVSPVVGDGRIYVAMSVPRPGVAALALDDGRELWRRSLVEVLGTPLSGGDTLFVRTGERLMALDAETGATLWRSSQRGRWPAPIVDAGGALVLADETDSIRAVSRGDGTPVWSVSLPGGARGAPAVVDDTLYVAGVEGAVVALTAAQGREIWRTSLGCRVYGSVAASAEAIYVAGLDGILYVLDPGSGSVLWRVDVDGAVQGSPALAGEVVAVCTMAATCHLISIPERRIIHTLDLDKPVRASVVVEGRRLFVVDEEGNVHAYESS